MTLSIFVFFIFELDVDYISHFSRKTFFYTSLSLSAIFFLMAIKNITLLIFEKSNIFAWVILYANRNSYGLFLLHTLVLHYTEEIFGWQDLSNEIHLALLRLVIVVLISMLLAKPFTMSTELVRGFLFSKLVQPRPLSGNN